MRRSLLLSCVLFGGLIWTGCGHGYIAATIGPPPPNPYVVGPVGVAPGPGYVWADGYWNLNGNSWAWAPGAWVVPPRGHRIWARPHWERHGRNWRFHRGRWH